MRRPPPAHFEVGGPFAMSVAVPRSSLEPAELTAEIRELMESCADFRGRIPAGALALAVELSSGPSVET